MIDKIFIFRVLHRFLLNTISCELTSPATFQSLLLIFHANPKLSAKIAWAYVIRQAQLHTHPITYIL